MPLQRQILEFPYAAGFTEKVAKQVLDPSSSLTTVSNLSRKQAGALVKRPGNTALPTAIVGGGAVAAGQRAYAFRDEITVSDGMSLYSYSPKASAWRNVGLVPECAVSRFSLGGAGVGNANTSLYDVAIVGGYVCVLRQDPTIVSGGAAAWALNLYVYDQVTLSIVSTQQIQASYTPFSLLRLLGNGATALVMFSNGSSLYTFSFTPSTLTLAQTFRSSSTPTFADASTLGTGFVVVFASGTSPVTFTCEILSATAAPTSSFTVTSTSFNASDTTISALAVAGNTASDFFFSYFTPGSATGLAQTAWMTAGGALIASYRTANITNTFTVARAALVVTTASATAPAVTLAGSTYAANNTAAIGAVQASAIYYQRYVANSSGGTITAAGAVNSVFNVVLAGRPAQLNGRLYVQIKHYDPLQQQAAIVELTGDVGNGPLRPVALYAARLSEPAVYCLPSLAANGSMLYGATRTLTSKFGSGIVASIELVKVDFSGVASAQGAEYALELGLTGGSTSLYDGRAVVETNFWVRPNMIGGLGTGTGTINGTYQYCAVFAYVDAAGNVERSAPSVVSTVTVSNVASIAYTVDSLPVTAKNGAAASAQSVSLEIYRTIAGGSIFYYEQSVPASPLLTTGRSGTSGPSLITGSLTDTQLQANPQLYSQPGNPGEELAHQCPPGLTGLIVHADRLVGIGDDGVTLWYSSQYTPGLLPWWQSQTVLTVDAGGRVRALGSMLGNLYVFQRDAIWWIQGAGPPPNGGTGQEFTPPALLASDVGCLDPRSVVLTPMGLLFRSARGIYLIDQSNNVSFIGEDVQLTTAAYPVTSSVVLLDAVSRVYWTMLPSEGAATGLRIVFDYQHGTWSTDLLDDAATGPANVGAVGAALTGGYATTPPTYTWLAASGVVHQENLAAWLDGSTWVEAQIETPPIHLAGILGFQRVWSVDLLFERITPHDILVEFAYDMGGYNEAHTFTAAQIAAMPSPSIELSVFPRQQKCRTLQVRVSDGSPTGQPVGTGQGSTWVAMRLEIGSKGSNRNSRSEEG